MRRNERKFYYFNKSSSSVCSLARPELKKQKHKTQNKTIEIVQINLNKDVYFLPPTVYLSLSVSLSFAE